MFMKGIVAGPVRSRRSQVTWVIMMGLVTSNLPSFRSRAMEGDPGVSRVTGVGGRF